MPTGEGEAPAELLPAVLGMGLDLPNWHSLSVFFSHSDCRIEATNMGKGNNSRVKEKKKPKKAAAPKAVPMKPTPPPKKP
jgi:hypothetical protein